MQYSSSALPMSGPPVSTLTFETNANTGHTFATLSGELGKRRDCTYELKYTYG